MPLTTKTIKIALTSGNTETLTLKPLSILGLDRACTRLAEGSTPAFVAECCGKPLTWIDSIDPEAPSYGELVAAAFELNFERAVRHATADPLAGSRLAPVLKQMAQHLEAALKSGEPSNSSSPVPAPVDTVPGIPSAPSIAPSTNSSISSPSTTASSPAATSGISTPATPPSPEAALPSA